MTGPGIENSSLTLPFRMLEVALSRDSHEVVEAAARYSLKTLVDR